MRNHRTAALACVAASTLLWTSSALAQATVAEALYQDAQRLITAGDVHGACLKFAESQKADPAIGTLINLANCHEQEGRTATAWSEFTDAASQAQRSNQHDRELFAKGKAAALEKKLYRLVIEVPKPPPGMVIRLDGAPFGVGTLGTPIPLDPGEHNVQVSAPGKKQWTQTVKMGPGAVVTRIEVPPLEDGTDAGPAAPDPVTGAPATEAPAPKRSIVPWIVGGVGVAGLALGGVMAGLTASKRSDLDAHCHGSPLQCDATGLSDASSGKTFGTVSTIGLIAGGVGVGLAAFMIITKKPTGLAMTTGYVSTSVKATADGGRWQLEGTW